MPDAAPIVLWAWVPVTLLLFWRMTPSKAAAASMIGGWLILPTARFADDVNGVAFPYWIMPSCLPSDYWTTKARVIGVAILVGISAFDPGAWRRLRSSWFDLPMIGWCLVPIASGLVNGLPKLGLADSIYQTMAWGVPYLVGRMYFSDPNGLDVLVRGIVGGGVVCLPLCAVEFVLGPGLYAMLYGFHPYETQGMARYVGYRPVVFFEDGNQLGTWLASSALAAAWLWRSGRLAKFWGMPGALVAGVLVVQSVLSQSAGAVALLVVGLGMLEAIRRVDRTWPIAVAFGLLLALVGARAANLFDAKGLAMKTSIGRELIDASRKLDRASFGWRLQVEQRSAKVALRKPVLGWARWDWWRAGESGERPWGLLSLVLGSNGLVGWLLLLSTFAVPIVAFLNLGPPRFWSTPSRASASALAGVLAINELDAILNPCFLLPMMAAAGALVGFRMHSKNASAWMVKLQGGPPNPANPRSPGDSRWSTTWLLGSSWPGSRSR